jgi:hypothetical protein
MEKDLFISVACLSDYRCSAVGGHGSGGTVVSGKINPDWGCLQANQMSTSSKTDNLICLFEPSTTFNRPDTTVAETRDWLPLSKAVS